MRKSHPELIFSCVYYCKIVFDKHIAKTKPSIPGHLAHSRGEWALYLLSSNLHKHSTLNAAFCLREFDSRAFLCAMIILSIRPCKDLRVWMPDWNRGFDSLKPSWLQQNSFDPALRWPGQLIRVMIHLWDARLQICRIRSEKNMRWSSSLCGNHTTCITDASFRSQ